MIVYGHRSIYCSCDADCDADAKAVRDGPTGLEALFMKHGVDVWINGHEHNYERNYPTFNFTLVTRAMSGAPGGTGAAPEVIVNPAAPVYIVEGVRSGGRRGGSARVCVFVRVLSLSVGGVVGACTAR